MFNLLMSLKGRGRDLSLSLKSPDESVSIFLGSVIYIPDN